MRKHTLQYIGFVIGQIICGGILLFVFAWMTGTAFDLSQARIAHYGSSVVDGLWASAYGIVWFVSLLAIILTPFAILSNVKGEYTILRHSLQPNLVKPFAFRPGLVA